MLKRIVTGLIGLCCLIGVGGCSSSAESSSPEPTQSYGTEPSSSKPSEETIATLMKRSCKMRGDVVYCDEESVALYSDGSTSKGATVDLDLVGQYREAVRDSKIPTAVSLPPTETNCTGQEDMGVVVSEWGSKKIFFCEYDNIEDDPLYSTIQVMWKTIG